jgi:threonine aldolase
MEVEPSVCAKSLAAQLKEQDILAIAIAANQLRFVTHLDITPEMVQRTISVLKAL